MRVIESAGVFKYHTSLHFTRLVASSPEQEHVGGPGTAASSPSCTTLRVAATHPTDVHELSTPGRVDAGKVDVGINGSKYGT